MRAKSAPPRPRHYVAGATLRLLAPFFRYSEHRGAYVLRLIGSRRGPVLKLNRRRRRISAYDGSERRRVGSGRVVLS